MRERKPVALPHEDAGLLGLQQCGSGVPVARKRCGDARGSRARERRHSQSRLLRRGRQAAHTRPDELLQALWHGEWIPRPTLAAVPVQRTRELEREEGVAARDGLDPDQRRPREFDAQLPLNHVVQRRQRERTELEPLQRLPLESAIESERRPVGSFASARHEQSEARGESTADERERTLGRLIQPLRVVERDDERTLGAERAQHAQQRARGRARIRRRHCLPPQQRDLERLLLRCRQLAAHLVERAAEEIAKRGVGKLRLRLRRARLQHAIAPLVGRAHGLEPQGCLADAGLPFDRKRDGAVGHALDEPSDRIQLELASDHRGHHARVTAFALPG